MIVDKHRFKPRLLILMSVQRITGHVCDYRSHFNFPGPALKKIHLTDDEGEVMTKKGLFQNH